MSEKKPRTVTVLEDLRDINEANALLREQIRIAKEEKARALEIVTRIEAETRVDVSKARDEDGKKLYSNPESRDAAVEVLLRMDGEDSALRIENLELIDKLDISINVAKNYIEKNLGEWKILFAEIELLTAQLTASANRAVVDAIGDV